MWLNKPNKLQMKNFSFTTKNVYLICFTLLAIWGIFINGLVSIVLFNIVFVILMLFCSVVYLFGDLFFEQKPIEKVEKNQHMKYYKIG